MAHKRDLSSPLAATPDFNFLKPDPDKKAARKAKKAARKNARGARKALKSSKRLEAGKGKGVQPVQEKYYPLKD
jgi:hypothetical protein